LKTPFSKTVLAKAIQKYILNLELIMLNHLINNEIIVEEFVISKKNTIFAKIFIIRFD